MSSLARFLIHPPPGKHPFFLGGPTLLALHRGFSPKSNTVPPGVFGNFWRLSDCPNVSGWGCLLHLLSSGAGGSGRIHAMCAWAAAREPLRLKYQACSCRDASHI